jgi:hypothetical protein
LAGQVQGYSVNIWHAHTPNTKKKAEKINNLKRIQLSVEFTLAQI